MSDQRLLKLIRTFLRAGVMESGLVSPMDEGTPQGGPLSPLLSNIVLDEFDRELERRGFLAVQNRLAFQRFHKYWPALVAIKSVFQRKLLTTKRLGCARNTPYRPAVLYVRDRAVCQMRQTSIASF